jgi:mRNA interferase RelE/StbE
MYKVLVSKRALKAIDRVPRHTLIKIKEAVNDLANNPRPFGYIKLIGSENAYRIRVGDYRIIYTIYDKILTVEVIKIDNRNSIYN